MTSLLPLLPETLRLPAAEVLAAGPAGAAVPGGALPDFAGLLEAIAAAPLPSAGNPAALAGVSPPEAAEVPVGEVLVPSAAATPNLAPRAETSPASALASWPTGKNLPDPGAPLPPALPPAAAGEGEAAAPLPAVAEAAPTPALPEAARPPARRMVERAPTPDSVAPAISVAPEDVSPVEVTDAGENTPAQDPAQEPAAAPSPALALAPQPLIEALLPAEPAKATPPTAPVETTPALLAALPLPAVIPAHVIHEGATGEPAAKPARLASAAQATPFSPPGPGAGAGAAHAAPVPALAAEPKPASATEAGALPDPGLPATATASATPSALPVASPTPLAERPVDPRLGAAPAAPAAPQLESAIAQVGDIREALRSARPAMTLQHAEFGAVAIRLEPAAPDQWRAVLASRDPGFVPAIHAALDARAIAAVADASANFTGQNGASQNGAGDHRYGASPNGGQGSSQPYLGQSGQRDGEAAPGHRRPSTAAALAARSEDGAEERGGRHAGSGGLFA